MLKINNNRAFTLVEVMIVVGIISLLAAIAIPNLISMKRTANEASAKANIRSLASAAETASVSLGRYPANVGELQNFISSAPSYCADFTGTQTAIQGYNYSCTMDSTGYSFVANPVTLGTTGSITYTVTTGGILTPL
ncbi:MAG: prepilin-type N-terminal cleavage/methylation domain-containing protein [Candidatus Omnitrophota bacterium]